MPRTAPLRRGRSPPLRKTRTGRSVLDATPTPDRTQPQIFGARDAPRGAPCFTLRDRWVARAPRPVAGGGPGQLTCPVAAPRKSADSRGPGDGGVSKARRLVLVGLARCGGGRVWLRNSPAWAGPGVVAGQASQPAPGRVFHGAGIVSGGGAVE